MRKKRIILLIIAVIIIALGIKGLLMYNNRQYIGGNGLQYLDEQSSPPRENVDNKDKYDLVKINIDSLSGKENPDSNNFVKIPATIDELKGCSYFTKEKPEGEIIVEILNSDYDVIKSFTVKSGEKTSKMMIVKSDNGYIINVKSNKFHGMYQLKGNSYNIF